MFPIATFCLCSSLCLEERCAEVRVLGLVGSPPLYDGRSNGGSAAAAVPRILNRSLHLLRLHGCDSGARALGRDHFESRRTRRGYFFCGVHGALAFELWFAVIVTR